MDRTSNSKPSIAISLWRSLFPGLVGPVLVVMPRVLGQDLPEVSFVVDKQVVEAFAPQRSYISFRKRVRPGRADRCLDDLLAVAGEQIVECRRHPPLRP